MRTRFVGCALGLLLTVFVFAAGYTFGQSSLAPFDVFGPAAETPDDARKEFRPFWETWQLLHDEYVDQPLDDQVLAEGALEGMLATLGDPNTRYLSPVAERAARNSIQGNFEGIGAEISVENESITIIAAYEGSPAEAAGLKSGDILLEANGTALTGLAAEEAAALVRGEAGTDVQLLVERNGETFEVTVTRDVIKLPSVRGELLDEGIAYIRLSRFADNTVDELEDLLASLMAKRPTGMVLDLRRNPGGGLSTAVKVADQFLDEGPVVIERFGNGREDQFQAHDEGLAQEVPLVVLIDEGSASASELLAGAIRDRDRGILVGETSFGKGTVQSWTALSNGGGVRITIARWLTPDGVWVHEEGLQPDLTVGLPDVADGEMVDSQLQAAIDYLLDLPLAESPSAGPG